MLVQPTIRVSIILGICSGFLLAGLYSWMAPFRTAHGSVWTLVWGAAVYAVAALVPLLFVVGRNPGGATWCSLRDRAERARMTATILRLVLYLLASIAMGSWTWYILGAA